MRAWRVHEFGEPADVLVAEEVDPPTAADLVGLGMSMGGWIPIAEGGRGPYDDWVLLDMTVAALALPDVTMARGSYPVPVPRPYTSGQEGVGIVVDAGPTHRRLLGSRVAACCIQPFGSLAPVAIGVGTMFEVPDDMTDEEGAAFVVPAHTAYHVVHRRGRVQPGETVLILGASGATGLAAVQVAKLLGANVIATGRSDEKLAVVKSLGADHVLNTRGPDGGVRRFRDEVKALTGGEGVDVVYDGVGGELSLESLKCVRFGARFLIVGWASTPFVAKGKGQRGAPNANQLPTNLIMMKGLDVLGCPTVISAINDPSLRAPRHERLWRWVESGQLNPHVSHVFPLAEVKEAMRAKWRGDVIGGCVVHP